MGEWEPHSQPFSTETRGPRRSRAPQEPEAGAPGRGPLTDAGMEQASDTPGVEASPGPGSARRLGPPLAGWWEHLVARGTGRAHCSQDQGEAGVTRSLCLSQRGPASHMAAPRGGAQSCPCSCPSAKLTPFSRPQFPELPSPAKPAPGPRPQRLPLRSRPLAPGPRPQRLPLRSWPPGPAGCSSARWELSSGPRLEAANSEDVPPLPRRGSWSAACPPPECSQPLWSFKGDRS